MRVVAAKDLKVGDVLCGLGPITWVEHHSGEVFVDYDSGGTDESLVDTRSDLTWSIE